MLLKRGVDAATSIEPGDLWDFDREVAPLLEKLVGTALEAAHSTAEDELRLAAIRQRRRVAEQVRYQELLEVQCMEGDNRRREEARLRQQKEEAERERRQRDLDRKLVALALARDMVKGSSSLKFKIFEIMENAGQLATIGSGLLERIGDPVKSRMKANKGPGSWRQGEKFDSPLPDHQAAMHLLDEWMARTYSPQFHQEVHSVGHRVVHGGTIAAPCIVNEKVRGEIEVACELAPLHNPPNLHGIDAGMKTFASVPHVAVFDTTFHATLTPEAYMYALPYELYEKHRIRRYGFHGVSYSYLTRTAAALLGKAEREANLILCHLGAGSSMCAVRNGQSIDTTMGFTPLEGLMMGSRCGDIDPAIVPYLMDHGMTPHQVHDLMNFQSGFLGMAGDVDVRSVEEAAVAGDEQSQLALAVYVRRIRKYLGAYLVHLGGRVDALVFSAGIGENGDLVRRLVCQDLQWAGVSLDEGLNRKMVREVQGEIQAPDSRVKGLPLQQEEPLGSCRIVSWGLLVAGTVAPAAGVVGQAHYRIDPYDSRWRWSGSNERRLPALTEFLPAWKPEGVYLEGTAGWVLVIPTDEQLEIAQQTLQVVARHAQEAARA
ncbi:hypothetical protein N2152v2_003354 [Parachlorella kessleri]